MALDNQLDNIALFKHYLSPSQLKPTQRLVLLGIFKHRNNCTFMCFPSVDTIAECTGFDRRTVLRALEQLEDSGDLIRVKLWHGKRVYRTYYFSPFDFMEAKRIAEDEDSIFYKAGDEEILGEATELFREAMKRNAPF